MKKKGLQFAGSCLLTLVLTAPAGDPAGAEPSPSATPGVATSVTCAFSNPGYSGWCRVTQRLRPGARPRRFCSQVLTCLNDSRCTATYCNATTIRMGWKLESVQTTPSPGSTRVARLGSVRQSGRSGRARGLQPALAHQGEEACGGQEQPEPQKPPF